MLGLPAISLAGVRGLAPGGDAAAGIAGPAAAPAPAPAAMPMPAAAPAREGAPVNRTMLGLPAAAPMNRTMLGLPVAAPAPAAPAPAAPAPAAPTPAAPPSVSSSPAHASPAATAAAASPPAPAPAPAPSSAGPAGPASIPAQTNRTMLGMSVSALPGAPAPGGSPPAAPAAIPAQTNRTMLGMSLQALPGQPPASVAPPGPGLAPEPGGPAALGHPPHSHAPPASADEPVELPTSRARSPAALFAVLALVALLALVASAIGLYLAFRGGGPPLDVTIAQVPEGEALDVALPDAPPGTKIRLGDREAPVEGGRARVPLAANALHVGDNTLAVEIVEPGGAVSRREVRLNLDFRVRADLEALGASPPGLDIVVEAVPGSTVLLDGAPLALDPAGKGTRRYALDPRSARDGVIAHAVAYAITPPGGAPTAGTVSTRVPLTTMRLDRPGTSLVTDRAEVDVAGVVEAGATVTIDGDPVEVVSGHFLVRRPLPDLGEHRFAVVARSPRKLPASVAVTVTRVADLAAEARRFPVERGLGYAQIRTAPATFVGRRVMIEGHAFNVEIAGGRSVVQILAKDCPRGDQCPVWVEYPASTDLTAGRDVRVFGTVGGEQQFRSETGRTHTVPRIDAAFLVPVGG
jgi:hypothetical protein